MPRTSPVENRVQAAWRLCMDAFGIEPSASMPVFQDLVRRYQEPQRHYHNLRHIAQALTVARFLADLVRPGPTASGDAVTLLLAILYHDAVYDPRRSDNEARSADLATQQLKQLAIPQNVIQTVDRCIRLTASHQPERQDTTGQILCDADLAILSAKPGRYAGYCQAIRREYAWVPESRFVGERAKVLRGFLARAWIYHTETMRRLRETRARANLERELMDMEAAYSSGGE